jgi:hypothetical protein
VDISQNTGLTEVADPTTGRSNPNFCGLNGQGHTIDQFSRDASQEANAQESCKPQVDPVSGYHSAENLGTSEHSSGRVPEYGPYVMPMPSKVKAWQRVMSTPTSVKSIGVRENPNLNDNSNIPPPLSPKLSYSSKPQYGMSQNVLILTS